ncbi:hypothetical protein [Microbacterium sp. SD291]|uniref:hypothetical protein n=1 Tax=Microbacterium sp. SD291 TaxID=2782007 RepID=UPI001A965819|nr:hypothetical protein [Microbacterium sp. SD291]MBO0980639.1 ABC transporter [Microbacterium sp. SD291]
MTPTSRTSAALLVATALIVAGTTGCAPADASAPGAAAPAGDIVDGGGAAEVAEPARALVIADEGGELTLLDLETEERTVIAASSAEEGGAVTGVDTDGRFLFVTREAEEGSTVTVTDSGRWTMPHGDHSHYFRGEPRTLGSIEGDGAVTVGIGSDGTAVAFAGGRERVVLDHEALAEGGTDAATRSAAGPSLPFAGEIVELTPAGIELPGAPVTLCAEPAGADITRVGLVLSCAGGAVLITREVGGALAAETIPHPSGADAPAIALSGRADRPDLAGVTSDGSAWLLDVRARSWTALPSDVPLIRAAAVGDDDARTVGVDADGAVRILATDGSVIARTEPLLAASVSDPLLRDRMELLVDAGHAYVSDAAAGAVHEIDLDDARVIRSFTGLQPWSIVQVG